MKKITNIVLLGAGILLSATGCQKGTSASEFAGQQVNFTAVSGNPATKTVYTGEGTTDANGNLTWERIDWKVGDQILVWSDEATGRQNGTNHEAKYSITGITSRDGNICKANIDAADTQGLVYGDRETPKEYSFWSIYPAAAGTSAVGWTDNKVTYTIPSVQTPDGDPVSEEKDGVTLLTLAPNMDNAIMLAAVTGTSAMEEVTLPFYPAFTSFEINLRAKSETGFTLKSLSLSAANATDKIAGQLTASVAAGTRTNGKGKTVGASTVTTAPDAAAVTYTFPEAITVTASQEVTFTVFAAPVDLNGLKLAFTFQNGEELITQTATLKKDGENILFGACEKHRIVALSLDGAWNFQYLDLEGNAIDWDDVELTPESQNYPEATQFEVTGVNNGRYYETAAQEEATEGRNAKAYRQYWLLDGTHTATVRFKVMSPVGYYWKVVPQGDTDSFTITPGAGATLNGDGTLTGGPIESGTTTNVNFSVAQNATGSDQKSIYFKTYVYSEDSTVQYSLDTETQLLDMRGYHYFILNWDGSAVK